MKTYIYKEYLFNIFWKMRFTNGYFIYNFRNVNKTIQKVYRSQE